ncbi:unnamed protein product, partial [marine sediment metagenome]
VGRIGGDEFAVLAIEALGGSAEDIRARLERSLETCNAKPGRRYTLSLSVGIATYEPQSAASLDELMARADVLMYEHKRSKQDI